MRYTAKHVLDCVDRLSNIYKISNNNKLILNCIVYIIFFIEPALFHVGILIIIYTNQNPNGRVGKICSESVLLSLLKILVSNLGKNSLSDN